MNLFRKKSHITLRSCLLALCFDPTTLIEIVVSWIIKTWCLCYLPQPSASADNTDLVLTIHDLYHAQPHPIITHNPLCESTRHQHGWCHFNTLCENVRTILFRTKVSELESSVYKNTNYYTLNSLPLFWLAESVQWIFEISARDVITADNTIIMSRTLKVTGNHIKFVRFLLLPVSEGAKPWLLGKGYQPKPKAEVDNLYLYFDY